MRVVVVGAGAVGQVFAHHLQKGGATVAFRVRSPERVRRPLRLYPLRGRREPIMVEAPIFGTDAEVASFAPDVVLLTVPADALHGPWLPELLNAVPNAAIVALEPGRNEAKLIRDLRPGVSLTLGIIAFIAYFAPLPGESRFSEPGVAYWLPPLGRCPFDGPLARPWVEVLNRGGLPSEVRTALEQEATFASPAMSVYVTSLKAASWSFARAFSSDVFDLGFRALHQNLGVLEQVYGSPRPGWTRWLGPRAIRTLLRLARVVLPMDIETYLGVHFTKVGAQTRMYLSDAVREGRSRNLPVDALEELLDRADRAQAPPAAG